MTAGGWTAGMSQLPDYPDTTRKGKGRVRAWGACVSTYSLAPPPARCPLLLLVQMSWTNGFVPKRRVGASHCRPTPEAPAAKGGRNWVR